MTATAAFAACLSAATASADPTFPVQNAAGGIYWRSGPDWNTAEASPGFGVYNGTTIAVRCYQAGAANVPGSANGMWEQATDVRGQGHGSGWINEHFIADGQTLNQPSPGVPPCDQSSPSPTPAPTVTTAAQPNASLVYPAFNADGGIYYRNAPHWADTSQTPGVGIYNGDRLQLICAAYGDGVGPFDNTAWSYVTNLSRNVGNGWVNEHFISDGAADNAFSSGEPICGPDIPGAANAPTSPPAGTLSPTIPTSSGGSSPVGGGSLYYSPFSYEEDQSPATLTEAYSAWHPTAENACPNPQSAVPGSGGLAGGKLITTLAAWSAGRTGPLLFLLAKPAWMYQVHYILLFDPANKAEYEQSPCTQKYGYDLSLALASWLAHDPSNSLVVLAGETTADYAHPNPQGLGHAGLQDVLFPAVKVYPLVNGRNIRKQVVVCNYDEMNHEGIWNKFKGYMNSAPITISTCPPTPGYLPVHPAFGWNP